MHIVLDNLDKHRRRMAAIREIAKGIFDDAERKAVLTLVKDYEALVGANPS